MPLCLSKKINILLPDSFVFGLIVRIYMNPFIGGIWTDEYDYSSSGSDIPLGGLHKALSVLLGNCLLQQRGYTRRHLGGQKHHVHLSRWMACGPRVPLTWTAVVVTSPRTSSITQPVPLSALFRKLSWAYRKRIYCTYEKSSCLINSP